MVPSNLKVLAKFGLCSNCSQKLDDCLLARTRKIFASARVLGFSLNPLPCSIRIICTLETIPVTETENNVSHMGYWETLGKHACAMNVFGKMLPRFAEVY